MQLAEGERGVRVVVVVLVVGGGGFEAQTQGSEFAATFAIRLEVVGGEEKKRNRA